MSEERGNLFDINLTSSKINNDLNDEEILIANNDNENDQENTQENDENKNYQYNYNNLYNNTNNNFDEIEDDEKSDDTIVAFQEEKNSNLLESNDNIIK